MVDQPVRQKERGGESDRSVASAARSWAIRSDESMVSDEEGIVVAVVESSSSKNELAKKRVVRLTGIAGSRPGGMEANAAFDWEETQAKLKRFILSEWMRFTQG